MYVSIPEVFQMVIDRGHRVGNHTFNHIQGIKFWTKNYLANVEKAAEIYSQQFYFGLLMGICVFRR